MVGQRAVMLPRTGTNAESIGPFAVPGYSQVFRLWAANRDGGRCWVPANFGGAGPGFGYPAPPSTFEFSFQ